VTAEYEQQEIRSMLGQLTIPVLVTVTYEYGKEQAALRALEAACADVAEQIRTTAGTA
jgi:hypothetical protein